MLHINTYFKNSYKGTVAMANFSGDRKYETYNQLFCSEEALTGISEELTFFAVLNIPLSVTAFLGNILIQVALHKESSLHPPTKLLLRSLSASDLCVGLISEPITVIAWFSAVKEHSDFCRYALNSSVITTFTLGTVSLLTLIAISVDRRSRFVARATIQASCDVKANTDECYCNLDYLHYCSKCILFEFPLNFVVWQYRNINMSCNLYDLLHKDFS